MGNQIHITVYFQYILFEHTPEVKPNPGHSLHPAKDVLCLTPSWKVGVTMRFYKTKVQHKDVYCIQLFKTIVFCINSSIIQADVDINFANTTHSDLVN